MSLPFESKESINQKFNQYTIIVVEDEDNTFEGTVKILEEVIPFVDYKKAFYLTQEIEDNGQVVVWSGLKEHGEMYWEILVQKGLSLLPLKKAK